MGLALEALRQGDTADFRMVLAGGELSLDAWIDMLQVGPLAARQIRGSGGDELQPGGSGQRAAAAFHQQQVVVMGIAAVQVPLIAGSRQLLAVGGLPQQTDGIGNPLEVAPRQQVQIKLVDRQQPGVGGLGHRGRDGRARQRHRGF